MTPADTHRNATVWPLADLFEALRREGFQLRPDDYVEVVQVLNVFQPQSHTDLRALIAPLIVTSDEEQEKFDRIFETVQRKEGIEPYSVEKKPLVAEVKKRFSWEWLIASLLGLLIFGYVAFLWPGPAFKTDGHMFLTGNSAGRPLQTGDTLIFRVDSSLRKAAGSLARWQWKTPDDQTYAHSNEPEVRVIAKRPGFLIVNLRSQRGHGLLFTAWADSARVMNTLICAKMPVVTIDSVRLSTTPLRYRFTAHVSESGQPVRLTQWQLDGAVMASNRKQWEHTFRQSSADAMYDVRFLAFPSTSSHPRFCLGEAIINLDVPGTNEPPFTLDVRQAGNFIVPKTQLDGFYFWGLWLVGGLITLCLGYYVWLVIQDRRRKDPETRLTDPEDPLARFVSDEPPLEIPLENREAELITRDQRFYQIVRTLRQPTEGEIRRLHVARTMQATMREGGFPTLIFQPHLVETEYLFLIDHSQVRSQQVALFEYLFRALVGENVCVERFFFHKTFDLFTNETHAKGLTLRQLADAYRQHTLLIWSNGYPLLYPPYPVVEPAIREALTGWESRAILTPVPFADWGSKERALQADFLLLPADVTGQLHLMQSLAEKQTRQDTFLRQQADELYSIGYLDFREVDELRDYLSEDLFQWLAALALYPRIRWEVVIGMGQALMPPEAVNFTNLLKLARISWLHEGNFPDYTRFDLLKALRPEHEAKARQTLLQMLSYAEQYFPGEHFYDGEKYLLQTVNQFALYAHDADTFAHYGPAQQEFKELYDKGLYPDGAMLRYLENPDGAWTTLLPATKPSAPAKAIESSVSRPRSTSLEDYFDNLPTQPVEDIPRPVDEPTQQNPRRKYALTAVVLLTSFLLGLWYLSTNPENQRIVNDQQIPVTVILDTNACVNALNTNIADSPRWTVFLNDSLYQISNLLATRSFPLRRLVARSVYDLRTTTLRMEATLAVNDSTAGGQRQYSSVNFTRDTLHVRINCPTPQSTLTDSKPPVIAASRLRVSVEYTNPNAPNFGRIRSFMNALAADTTYQFIRPVKPAVFTGRSQVRYFRPDDKTAAEAMATRASKALGITIGTQLTKDKRSPLTHLEVWVNNGTATQLFTCQPVPTNWIDQVNKWQAKVNGYTYTLDISGYEIRIQSESPEVPPTVDPKTGATYSVGTALSQQVVGTIDRICQQNSVYLVYTASRVGRTLLLRNVTRNSCAVAIVGINSNSLSSPQGQTYFNKLLKSASFRRYTASKQAKAKAGKTSPGYTSDAAVETPANPNAYNPAVQQAAKPGNDYEPNANQTNQAVQAPVQSNTENLQIATLNVKDATVQQGVKAAQRGQFDEAIKFYDQALEKNPNNASVLVIKGYSLFKLKRLDEAVNSLLAAIKAEPKTAWAYYNLALVYCAMGKSSEASDASRQAINLQPGMQTIMQNDKQFMSLCGRGATAR